MAEKRRLIVPLIALAIVANVLLYAVVVFPLGRQVASAEDEAGAARAARPRAAGLPAGQGDRLRASSRRTRRCRSSTRTSCRPTPSAARTLTYTRLAQLAKQANVELEHGTNAVEHEKGSQLSKLTTTYTLTGDYRDVRRFIYSLETAPEFIVLENVALTSAGEQEQSSAQPGGEPRHRHLFPVGRCRRTKRHRSVRDR